MKWARPISIRLHANDKRQPDRLATEAPNMVGGAIFSMPANLAKGKVRVPMSLPSRSRP
jgi:hypothetical protein